MKWYVPAKTFFLGEYAALQGGPAILLTTSPCFEIEIMGANGTQTESPFHPDSPAGRLWKYQENTEKKLNWINPYKLGGLGASSAQFVGAYLVSKFLYKEDATCEELLKLYQDFAWDGEGMCPSGYDVLAQAHNQCVYINREKHELNSMNWVFPDLSFLLVHTGKKITTHEHLKAAKISNVATLSDIAYEGEAAFCNHDAEKIVQIVNHYHEELKHLNLVADYTLEAVTELRQYPGILAAKGCGALGADVLLLLCPTSELMNIKKYLNAKNLKILATQENLYNQEPVFKNKTFKRLEISA